MAAEDRFKNLEKIPGMVAIPSCSDDVGYTQISNNAIATIVRKYLMSIDGVVRTAPQGLVEGLATIFGRKNVESSIALDLSPQGVVVTLALILRFGCNIPKVANEIKSTLFDRIPALTGYPVIKVNVNVVDLEEYESVEDEPAKKD